MPHIKGENTMDAITRFPLPGGAPVKLPDDKRCFEPVADLLGLSEHRPLGLERVDMRTLTPFQRALLVIDGTVTKFVEAYTLEPIEVVRLDEKNQSLSKAHPVLDLPAGEPVRTRQVLLQGRYSATVYAYAASVLALGRLPADLLCSLESKGGNLGRAILESQIENRRELLWDGRERFHDVPEPIRSLMGEAYLTRTYRIVVAGKPIVVINEKFPVEAAHGD